MGFPGIWTHSEFYYYPDSRVALDLLAVHRGLQIHPQMLEEIRGNREKDYPNAANRGQHMQPGFLQHSLMISRMHFMIEMACRNSGGQASLEAWSQGSQLAGRKVEARVVKSRREDRVYSWEEKGQTERSPVEPDALFTLRHDRHRDVEEVAGVLSPPRNNGCTARPLAFTRFGPCSLKQRLRSGASN